MQRRILQQIWLFELAQERRSPSLSRLSDHDWKPPTIRTAKSFLAPGSPFEPVPARESLCPPTTVHPPQTYF